uniref:Uncharacterized protein n=1 Tax=Zea mays TaxID=4577 RepID=B6TRD9_MAIZE|nr:hypothetical protein [Zea mays]
MSPAPSSGKRGRVPDPEEDVYVDNLHSHKRYLTEIMASSMNGLSVGDSVPDNIMGSPMRVENASCISEVTSHLKIILVPGFSRPRSRPGTAG